MIIAYWKLGQKIINGPMHEFSWGVSSAPYVIASWIEMFLELLLIIALMQKIASKLKINLQMYRCMITVNTFGLLVSIVIILADLLGIYSYSISGVFTLITCICILPVNIIMYILSLSNYLIYKSKM